MKTADNELMFFSSANIQRFKDALPSHVSLVDPLFRHLDFRDVVRNLYRAPLSYVLVRHGAFIASKFLLIILCVILRCKLPVCLAATLLLACSHLWVPIGDSAERANCLPYFVC